MTTIFFDNRGKISVVRTSLFFMGLGLLFIIGSAIFVAIETESARSPLHIAIPEGSQDWGLNNYGQQPYQESFYKVPTTNVDQVVEHYQQQAEQMGADACKRLPPFDEFPDYDPDDDTLIPYKWQCLFERANVPGVYQSTLVSIYPGVVESDDPNLNTEGFTIVLYEQHWQR